MLPKEKIFRFESILIAGSVIFLVFSIFTSPVLTESDTEIVPLFGLPKNIHTIFFHYIWLMGVPFITILVFPIIFAPLFLKIKRILWKSYQDAYIDRETIVFQKTLYFKRCLMIFLLTSGLQGFILKIFDEKIFLTSSSAQDFINNGKPLILNGDVLWGAFNIAMPLAVGLLAISWAMEDGGLIHYKFPESSKEFFEIEPIHFRYGAYIEGFAGISSFLFYISTILLYIEYDAEMISLFWLVTLYPMIILILIIPYMLFNKFFVNHLQKGLKKARLDKKALIFEN